MPDRTDGDPRHVEFVNRVDTLICFACTLVSIRICLCACMRVCLCAYMRVCLCACMRMSYLACGVAYYDLFTEKPILWHFDIFFSNSNF